MPHEAEIAAAVESAAVHYSRDHHDVNALAAAMPFAATRAMEPVATHRGVLADALDEAGRHDEADLARDGAKSIRLHHDGEEGGWRISDVPPRYTPADSSVRTPGGRPVYWTNNHAPRHLRQYLETALWASTGEDEDGRDFPLDEMHGPYDFTDEAVDRAHHDYQKFLSKLSPQARQEIEDQGHDEAAHDLWLTRNGHGAGFGDGDWEHGDELTAAAKSLGEQHVHVEPQPNGDATDADGFDLHLSGGRE